MAVAGEIERDEWSAEREGDRVEGVRVLSATVDKDQFGIFCTPTKSTQLAKPIDRHIEALYDRNHNVQAPLVKIFVKK